VPRGWEAPLRPGARHPRRVTEQAPEHPRAAQRSQPTADRPAGVL